MPQKQSKGTHGGLYELWSCVDFAQQHNQQQKTRVVIAIALGVPSYSGTQILAVLRAQKL